MLLGLGWVDVSVIILLTSLFLYVVYTRNQIQKQLEHQHLDLGQTHVHVVEQFQQNFNENSQPSFKDAKQMMSLRMDELKFIMLEKVASFASNKFLKGSVGLHQIEPPPDDDINKPPEPTP